jgi:hypothetical protein
MATLADQEDSNRVVFAPCIAFRLGSSSSEIRPDHRVHGCPSAVAAPPNIPKMFLGASPA